MSIVTLLTEIGSGIGSFLPALVTALVDGFVGLFFITDTSGTILGIGPVAIVSLTFFVFGACYKLIPMIAGWLKLQAKRKKRARKSK